MTNKKKKKLRLLADQAGRCGYCGRPLTFATSTLDHIVPRCRGGTNRLANLVVACRTCNEHKGARLHWTPYWSDRTVPT